MIVGVLSGLIVTVIGAMASMAYRLVRSGRSALGGQWYQVTYDPLVADSVWSIEWVSIRQVGNELNGTMWRIWRAPGNPKHLDRRWGFTARSHGSFLRGIYWSERGDGGEGVLRLFCLRRSTWIGRFEDEQPSYGESRASFEEFQAPMEWIRVGSERESGVLDLIRDAALVDLAKLDRRVRSRVERRLTNATKFEGLAVRLAYGGALQDLSAPLAIQVERIRESIDEHTAETQSDPSSDAGPVLDPEEDAHG